MIEIKSDTSLAEAVQILAQHRILSAPVVDVDAPQDATWMDRYIGIVEFAGIVVWILHQVRVTINLLILSIQLALLSGSIYVLNLRVSMFKEICDFLASYFSDLVRKLKAIFFFIFLTVRTSFSKKFILWFCFCRSS